MKEERIAIRTTTELKQEATRVAAQEHRTLSNYLEALIKRDLKERDVA